MAEHEVVFADQVEFGGVFPHPFEVTIRLAPSCRRSRTTRTNRCAASCTRCMSMVVPRSDSRTVSSGKPPVAPNECAAAEKSKNCYG